VAELCRRAVQIHSCPAQHKSVRLRSRTKCNMLLKWNNASKAGSCILHYVLTTKTTILHSCSCAAAPPNVLMKSKWNWLNNFPIVRIWKRSESGCVLTKDPEIFLLVTNGPPGRTLTVIRKARNRCVRAIQKEAACSLAVANVHICYSLCVQNK